MATTKNLSNKTSPVSATWREMLRLLRPQQWVKSCFVLVGPVFGHFWRQPNTVRPVFLAAAAFALLASAVYIFNDWQDREQDRCHPRKRLRPLTAGTVTPRQALALMLLLLGLGLALATWAGRGVLLCGATYLLVNLAYSRGLKHVVILDVFLIGSGFMLRLLAGTSGVGIAPSQWLLLCGMMLALFLGFAKRRAELYALNVDSAQHRRVLEEYSPVLLDKMIVITAACVVLMYSLYTTSPVTVQTHGTTGLIYTVPFVIYGLFRYLYALHRQQGGGDPAQELFRDPHLIGAALGWLATVLALIVRR